MVLEYGYIDGFTKAYMVYVFVKRWVGVLKILLSSFTSEKACCCLGFWHKPATHLHAIICLSALNLRNQHLYLVHIEGCNSLLKIIHECVRGLCSCNLHVLSMVAFGYLVLFGRILLFSMCSVPRYLPLATLWMHQAICAWFGEQFCMRYIAETSVFVLINWVLVLVNHVNFTHHL